MNDLESQLHYPLGTALPAPGEAKEVAPGVYWLRMALPFALDHINLWLLRDEMEAPEGGARRQGWTVVDCCIDHAESRAQWETIFAQHLQGLPILRVIATHMHPDHIGLAHWLCERWQAPLWISATDYGVARLSVQGSSNGGEAAARFFRMHGLQNAGTLAAIGGRNDYFVQLVPALPPSYRRLQDGNVLRIGGRDWRCIAGYGHAPEHIALYCDEPGATPAGTPAGTPSALLIGGDMMLPRISTNVSVYDSEPEANALQQFLDSIDRFVPLAEGTLTLPAHGKPFQGLHTRIAQLHAHHREHLARVLAAATQAPCSAADILPVLFRRKLDVHQTTFAMGEAIAHLHKLWFDGWLQRVRGADGVYRFAPTALGRAQQTSVASKEPDALPTST